jgi:hypothetical protein
MSLSREAVLELMALADGELEGEAKERAEKLALQSQEARRVVEAMRATEVRTWLGNAIAQRVSAADGIASSVMAEIASLPSTRRTDKRRSGRTSRLVPMSAVAMSALAIAAGTVIYLRSGNRTQESAQLRAGGIPSGGASTSPELSASPAGGSKRGVEVEEIDSTAHVSIFEISAIANASAPSSVVVWIDDEPGER